MTNKELNQFLVKTFPELKQAYDEEVSWQEGDDTGSHVVFVMYLLHIWNNLL